MACVVMVALWSAACARSTAAQPPTADPAPPVRVTVDGPAVVTPGTDIRVVVQLSLPGALGVPLHWNVQLPHGVTALPDSAPTKDVFTSSTAQLQRTLLLHVDRVPSQDVVVTVDAATPSWGVHATGAYRFGRPAPAAPQVPQDGPAVVLDGKSLGRPTLLDGK